MLYGRWKKQHFSYNLLGGESGSVGIGRYAQTSFIPIQKSFNCLVSTMCQEPLVLHYFLSP